MELLYGLVVEAEIEVIKAEQQPEETEPEEDEEE